MGPLEIASLVLSRAQQRVEVAAQNIANMTTPGFKARRQFSDVIAALQTPASEEPGAEAGARVQFADGKLQSTDNPNDLALSGRGFFVVRSGDGVFYTRNGQFHRDTDGRLVTPEGLALQTDNGDLIAGQETKIVADGTVLDGDQPVSRLRIADFSELDVLQPTGAGLFAAPDAEALNAEHADVHQGALEASNVSAADEMLTMMAALRSAETGQRVVQTYDDLLGRALTAFGQQ